MSLSIDFTSLPSVTSSLFRNESNSESTTSSGKSIGRNDEYVSNDIESFNRYMLNKNPDDITPYDSASNDPLTSFSIKSHAVKTNSDGGVSMDNAGQRSRPSSEVGYDVVDFKFSKAIAVNADLKASLDIDTNVKKSKSLITPVNVENNYEPATSKSMCNINNNNNKTDESVGKNKNKNKSADGHDSILNKQKFNFTDSELSEIIDSDDSDVECCGNCKYKAKYLKLRMKMKQVAILLIQDM
uniref:Non-structural protein 5 n=1 Tax=Rotavirus A TaxID=28875 RepID=A0A1V0FU09_9REOV|nr:NSP5 [Rotavirus A]